MLARLTLPDRVPPLSGPVLLGFRILWIACFAFTLLCATWFSIAHQIDLQPDLLDWIGFGAFRFGIYVWLATVVLLFLRRPGDPVVALISFGEVLNCLALSITPVAGAQAASVILTISLTLGGIGLLLFPDARFVSRWTWLGVPLIAAATIVRLMSGASSALSSVMFFLTYAFVLATIVSRFRHSPPGIVRQQIKFALLGYLVNFLGNLVSDALRAVRAGLPPGAPTEEWLHLAQQLSGMVTELGIAIGLLVALLRYRLYDADTVISRSAAYAFLTLLLGAVFAGSEKVIEVLGEEFFGEQMRALSAGLGAAIAATLVGPLHGTVHRWTEHRFQRALSTLRHDLPRLVADLRDFASLDHLTATVVDRLERGVHAASAAVLLRDEGELDLIRTSDITEPEVAEWSRGWQPSSGRALDCDRDDPVFPVRIPLHADGIGLVGWVLLGPRPDGSFYRKDEREALAEVADPIARAIHIVRRREAREAEERHARALLETRVAELEAAIVNRTAPA